MQAALLCIKVGCVDEKPRRSTIGLAQKRFASWQAQRALEAQRLVGAAE